MSAKSGSSLATILMSVPLAAIPLMAIFGIPQFAPVEASPDGDEAIALGDVQSDRALHDRYRRRASDLLSDTDDREPTDPLSDAPPYDPFRDAEQSARDRDRIDRAGGRSLSEPVETMRGRELQPWDDDGRQSRDALGDRSDVSDEARNDEVAVNTDAARFRETGGSDREPADNLTWRQAVRELSERGIENFRLERGRDAESFLFVCTLAPGDNPHVTMRFEAESIDPLAAVSNVIDQVDAWLRGRFAATQGAAAALDETP